MSVISWSDFEAVDIRIGTIIQVEDFPEIKNPSYKVWVDFGEELGVKKTSAQITGLYSKEEIIGKQVFGVVNFPPKQIGKFMSEFLLTGVDSPDGIILATVDKKSDNGKKLL
ncbi:tRNA-binding protein [Candidatus Gracilibacteria bacterium]|nr:tRNA-binding protein [Candidatus Gracilibacteria bacterium]